MQMVVDTAAEHRDVDPPVGLASRERLVSPQRLEVVEYREREED